MPSPIIMRPRLLPWVGTGTTGEWGNVSKALFDGMLDYEVEQTDAWDDKGHRVPGILVNRRTDTGEIMGVTSDQYGVVQNVEAFSLLDPFCQAGGIIEHAGMTTTGMCFMVMRMESNAFGFMGDDFDMYVCAMNSFNGKYPLAIIITPVRVYCQNLFRKLMKRGDTALMIKHGRFAADRILSASKATTLLLDYQEDFVAELEDAYEDNLRGPGDAYRFAEKMMPFTPVDAAHPRAKQTNERIEMMRKEFVNGYYMAADNLRYTGTRLGLLNAYYDWTTHHVPVRASMNFEDLRFSNIMNGTAISRRLIESA